MREHKPTLGRRLARLPLRVLGFVFVVLLVWITYVYLYAYQPDFLGWCFELLRPVTILLFQWIDSWLPETVKYKVSAGLTDELGPRALFLLVLGGLGELVVMSIVGGLRGLVRALR
ncbi:MAG: hypothetical protein R3D57_11060 [Hyphomicrobiaceae bacterium]